VIEHNCESAYALDFDALAFAHLANGPREGGSALYVPVHMFTEIITLD
jgi:hypothetical protein